MMMPDLWPDDPEWDSHLRRHVSRLRNDISALLAAGSVRAAYTLADRLCRIAPPVPQDLLTRCITALGLGFRDSAMRDLDACRAADGFDLTIARIALAVSRQADQRLDAARTIVGHPEASRRETRAATELIIAADPHTPLIRARRHHDRIDGSVAWDAAGPPVVSWASETASGLLDVGPVQTTSTTCRIGLFSASVSPEETVAIEAVIGTRSATLTLHAQTTPSYAAGRMAEASGGLTVIVPVHRDPDATRDCLASLRQQPGRFDVIVVDDHSPDPDVARVASEFCRATGARHIVNRVNLGFAGSVNKALVRAGRGDILLLNADVVLPDGALERLRRAAASAADIGTAMPLSNDSAGTSFPIRGAANPPLDRVRAAEVDRVAARVHGEQTADLVTNIGFCLYIREPCLRAVGLLSPCYGRGYFEDVEFCLKAEEHGFRNVAVPGVYVTHAGSRSFTSSKPRLVVRNSGIINARFPHYRARLAAEHWADPLHRCRSMIEEHLPPPGRRHLVIQAADRASPWLDSNPDGRLDLVWETMAGQINLKIRSADGGVPQSLAFVLDQDGSRQCRDYLARIELAQITLAGVAALPEAVIDLVSSLDAPVGVLVISRACLARLPATPGGVEPTAAAGSRCPIPTTWTVDAGDAMALAAVRGRSRSITSPPPVRPLIRIPRLTPERPNLGIVAPWPSSEVDRLLRALAQTFVEAATSRMVVFGQCMDDLSLMRTGAVDVLGPIDRDEYAELFERYRIGAVLSPYRSEMFGPFDAATLGSKIPRVYFDWSDGAFGAPEGDCVLDRTLGTNAVSLAFAAIPARAGEAFRH